tara:strand:- start:21521 stop:21979 length:459 start_codon:yes stop_codon:yes gene_type:complete
MNIGDFILYEEEEYTIEAKTVGGDKLKISRNTFNNGLFRNRQKTTTLWVDRGLVTQIMTLVGDEEPSDVEETLVHNLRAELRELLEAIEVMKHQSPQHHFLRKYEEMMRGDWSCYHHGHLRKRWRLYNSKDDSVEAIGAETLEELIKKVNES